MKIEESERVFETEVLWCRESVLHCLEASLSSYALPVLFVTAVVKYETYHELWYMRIMKI